ncbi:uncharacterized protein LOC113317576 [Papaver somniferum]|uniref:uncharacterized protein LOC113317576 n=1 Tax=Papaver somniferum TaxID=3469 RepID=UPI000E705D8F|nr:uncharacterized protein LOC113317576 [Papaver somniferum]
MSIVLVVYAMDFLFGLMLISTLLMQDEGLMEAQQGIEEITGELGISFIRVTDGAKMVFIRIKFTGRPHQSLYSQKCNIQSLFTSLLLCSCLVIGYHVQVAYNNRSCLFGRTVSFTGRCKCYDQFFKRFISY